MTSIATTPHAADLSDWFWFAALLALGGVFYFLCALFPAEMPFWMPWEFSWPTFLACALGLAWFFRGLRALPKADHPPVWRSIGFVVGVVSVYIVLQTHVDYYAQHMFFVHGWAQFVLRHAGAFLIALGCSAPVLRAGMPAFLKPVVDARVTQRTINTLQHPAIAPVLFVGLLYLWSIPQVHTRAMLDRNLYDVMNWTTVLDGILFWSLIVDPRPTPPARLTPLIRGLLILITELPQMLLGAILTLSRTDYYPVYKICGRVLPFSALSDQHFGGLIVWLPSVMMSLLAMFIVLINLRLNEEKAEHAQTAS
jgi:putative membrane protein